MPMATDSDGVYLLIEKGEYRSENQVRALAGSAGIRRMVSTGAMTSLLPTCRIGPISSSPDSAADEFVRCSAGVAAATPEAAETARQVLLKGGNAIDAACAAAWVLSVCEPGESGLGGQTVAMIRLGATGQIIGIDGHSRAPRDPRVTKLSLRARRKGVCATTVPTTPMVLASMQRRFGRLSLQEALAPAIALAEDGFMIGRMLARQLGWMRRFFAPGSVEAGLMLRPDGVRRVVGDRLVQSLLARTLKRFAERGVEDFYQGEMAREIAADMASRGGLMSVEDLGRVQPPVESEPMRGAYCGMTVCSLPPPSGGSQVLLALGVLEAMGPLPADVVERAVQIARATRAALIERERWPDHPRDLSPSLLSWLASPARAEMIAARLRQGRDPVPPRRLLGESGNTTHLCTADDDGNVVTLTQSIQSVFGAKAAHPTLGFFYNNYLCTCPSWAHPYRLVPGCLPQSNAAPTMVIDERNRVRLAIGSAGSRRITSSIVRVIAETIGTRSSLAEAMHAPRVHPLIDGGAWVESRFGAPQRSELAKGLGKVRTLTRLSAKLGGVHALAWDERGHISAAADPRRDGRATEVGTRAGRRTDAIGREDAP